MLAAGLALALPACTALASQAAEAQREYQVKAAFLYNFLMFVDGFGFQAEGVDGGRAVTIGVLGVDPFQGALEPLRDKRIGDRPIAIRRFMGLSQFRDADAQVPEHPEQEAIEQCDLLFIGSSEGPCLAQVLAPIAERPILTVAEIPGFAEKGGMIGLLTEQHKVRFDVNLVAAKRANLTIRSKLLRLARRIIEGSDARAQ